jgi:23S rRNA (cytosine1962-C5)-methyltransferase
MHDAIDGPEIDDASVVEYATLSLRRGEEARLRGGHLWVFSNEVDTQRTPLHAFKPGQPCVVLDHANRPLGVAYVNPNALICARLMSRGIKHELGRSLLVHKLRVALGLREKLYPAPYYRLAFGESDGLPGLVLDRYGDVIVGQIATWGMENLKDDIVAAVQKVVKPGAMLWKNAGSSRGLENLPEYVETAFGTVPERVFVEEAGLRFAVDPVHGQKTGWFYDQRANRDLLAPYVKDARVLDVFSYAGGWGIRAAHLGASAVTCIDASASAVALINDNARLNGVADRVTAVEADAFEFLKDQRHQRERYDVVIVDPPAFIKRKKDLVEGRLAYRRINEAAMQLLGRDGVLISCSCSYHLPRAAMNETVNQAARHLDRHVQVLSQLQQGPDHPVNPAIPETDYLKGVIARVFIA